ncbi:MAG: menaquinone biosynthesis protein [Phycisphaerales bacterium]
MPVRVAGVRFLNTIPLVDGLAETAGLQWSRDVPSQLHTLLESGRADIALVSSIDAARSRTPLAILDAGMIGSEGPTLTVRLFGASRPEQLEEVWLDPDSHTSAALCRLLLERRFGARPAFRALAPRGQAASGERGDAKTPDPSAFPHGPRTGVLLIGDKVITGAPPENLFPHQVDLGQAWHEWTGQPFVYAAWMCRADEADRPEIALAAALLDRQRRKNLVRLASLAAEHGPAAGWPVDLAERYLASHLRFDLGPRERAAAQRFIDECAALGLCPPAPLRWADWHTTAHAATRV